MSSRLTASQSLHSSPVRPVARPSAAAFRRRRVAAGVLGLTLVVLTAQGADAVAAGLRSSGPHTATTHYRVRSGDTLWSIARQIAPQEDPREVVDLLVQAHGSALIEPGDVIDWSGV